MSGVENEANSHLPRHALPHNPRMKAKPGRTAAVAAWLAIAAHAETAPPQQEPQPVLTATGAFFALSVADIDASGKWYSEKLGLGVIMQPQRSGPGAVMVLEGGGLIVELVQHDEALPLSRLTPDRSDAFKVHGHFKGGVIVKDLDKTLALLKSRDVPIAFGPYPAKEGRRANFIIRDNAGNLIHFFGPA
jgi:hypothetical protein